MTAPPTADYLFSAIKALEYRASALQQVTQYVRSLDDINQVLDSLLGNAVYRIRIRSVSPERLVFDTENTSTIRYFLFPLFGPSEVQSIYFFERESPDVWRYYNLARTSASSGTRA